MTIFLMGTNKLQMNSRVINKTGNRDGKHSTVRIFCIVKSFLNSLVEISEFGHLKSNRCEKISIIVKGNTDLSRSWSHYSDSIHR